MSDRLEHIATNVLAGCAGALLVSVVHELGHVFAALLRRFTLHTVAVLHIPLYIRNRKLPIRYKHESYVVASKANPTIKDITWFIVSGHLFSFTSGVLALLFFAANRSWLELPAQFGLVSYGSVSVITLIVEPFIRLSNGLRTDTQNLIAIQKQPDAIVATWGLFHALESYSRKRPAEIPDEVLDRLRLMTDYPHLYSLFRFHKHMDRAEVKEAQSFLEQAYQTVIEDDSKDYFALAARFDAAMYFARFGGDWRLSTTAYRAVKQVDKKHRGRYSAVAARAYARNHKEIAYQISAHSAKQVASVKQTDPELYEYVLDWHERIIPGFRDRYISESRHAGKEKRKWGFFG